MEQTLFRILIVDDEALARRDLSERIDWESQGFTVVGFASNGRRAMEQIQLLRPDIVLIDIKMPVMDGLQTIQTAEEKELDCVFIVLSCFEEYNLVRQALKLGAADYLLKHTCSNEEILAAVNHAVSVLRQRHCNDAVKSGMRRSIWLKVLKEPGTETELNDWIAAGMFASEARGYAMLEISSPKPCYYTTGLPEMYFEQVDYIQPDDGTLAILLETDHASSFRERLDRLRAALSDNLGCPVGEHAAAYCSLEEFQALLHPRDNAKVSLKMQRALDFMRQSYASHLTLESVAQEVGLSRTYFSQLFKNNVGVSFSEWLQDYRLQRARELLENSPMRIYEIADAVGFNGQSYFSVAFKKRFGVTPAEFRTGHGVHIS